MFYISQSKFLNGSFEVSLLLPNLLAIAFVVLSIFVEVDLHLGVAVEAAVLGPGRLQPSGQRVRHVFGADECLRGVPVPRRREPHHAEVIVVGALPNGHSSHGVGLPRLFHLGEGDVVIQRLHA